MCSKLWSDLPNELLEKLIQEHKEKDDLSHVARIRAVCKSWQSCIIPNPNLYFKPISPFLASFPCPTTSEEPEYDRVCAHEVLVVALHPLDPNNPNGGILKLKRENSGNLRALNPLVDYDKFLSNGVTTTTTTTSEVVNLLDYRVQLLHRYYQVEDRYYEYRCAGIRKAVVIGDIICAMFRDDCSATSWLALMKFGDEEWNEIEDHSFEDVTIYRDKLFAVDDRSFLFTVDPLSLRVTQIVAKNAIQKDFSLDCHEYLVESHGDLFLVAKDDERSYRNVVVYKLDMVKGQWECVMNLGDDIFFVGDPECSFSISAKDFSPGVCKKWNCLYGSFHCGCNAHTGCPVHRGLSTNYAYLYDMKHNRMELISSRPHVMDIFWNLEKHS